jgi:hypothetical protein
MVKLLLPEFLATIKHYYFLRMPRKGVKMGGKGGVWNLFIGAEWFFDEKSAMDYQL